MEHNFYKACVAEYYREPSKTEHVKDIPSDGKIDDNKIERVNGEISDREKVTRNLKKTDTPILKCTYDIITSSVHKLDGKTQ